MVQGSRDSCLSCMKPTICRSFLIRVVVLNRAVLSAILSFEIDPPLPGGNRGCCISKSFSDGSLPALKDVFKKYFLIGAAVSDDRITGRDAPALPLILSQFNSITPENCLKWDTIHPRPDVYDFEQADRFVAFGEKHQMHIVGHILLDKVQTPDWVFHNADRDTLLKRIQEHIAAVVRRYRGRIHLWHVVNEAIGADGAMQKFRWLEIIGEDYVQKAFVYAHQADPDVKLYYNGHDMLTREATRSVVQLARDIKQSGGRIDGIGVQAHWGLDYPSLAQVEEGIAILARSGLKIALTEMDITVLPEDKSGRNQNPYPDGLPAPLQEKLAKRYGDLFAIFRKYANAIDRVNFWGVDDGQSWLNDWPMKGRTDYPLLFDRQLQPKPAFFAVMKSGEGE
jgi:endo-1,4-beta-xylanase